MATTPPKRRKTPPRWQIEAILFGLRTWNCTRNTSWAWARDWWAQRGHAPVLIMRWHTYHIAAHYAWARTFLPAYGRE